MADQCVEVVADTIPAWVMKLLNITPGEDWLEQIVTGEIPGTDAAPALMLEGEALSHDRL